jgi:hypothetical protein
MNYTYLFFYIFFSLVLTALILMFVKGFFGFIKPYK